MTVLQPNDLPLVCLPTELDGAGAAQLLEFLYELTAAIERHYADKIHAHHHGRLDAQREMNFRYEHTNTDPEL